jgi:hypothetical protein
VSYEEEDTCCQVQDVADSWARRRHRDARHSGTFSRPPTRCCPSRVVWRRSGIHSFEDLAGGVAYFNKNLQIINIDCQKTLILPNLRFHGGRGPYFPSSDLSCMPSEGHTLHAQPPRGQIAHDASLGSA